MKIKCNNCKKAYKSLTSEFLCAFCHKDKYKVWSKEFSEGEKK